MPTMGVPETEPGSKIRHKLLIVEDDPAIRQLLKMGFKGTQFRVIETENGNDGIEQAAKSSPDLIVLDLGLPDMEGIEVLRMVRSWSQVPVIILSARGQEKQKVACLEAGADDYVTKPFGVNELIARANAVLRRGYGSATSEESAVFEAGNIKVDFSARLVTKNGEAVHLTPTEYKLLTELIRHEGKVVTHKMLLNAVWGPDYTDDPQYLRVYMGYLRKKLEDDPNNPLLIHTEPRVGYRLVA
ncbi:MAG: response regulator [Fimbriimonadaceae bacterium]